MNVQYPMLLCEVASLRSTSKEYPMSKSLAIRLWNGYYCAPNWNPS
jgi:hypothetical protein